MSNDILFASLLVRDIAKALANFTKRCVGDVVSSSISITDRYSQFQDVNNMLYRINKEKYSKYQIPGLRDHHILTPGSAYMIRLKGFNAMVVNASEEFDRYGNEINKIIIVFIGDRCDYYRNKFIDKAFDTRNIRVIGTEPCFRTGCDIMGRDFDHIILEPNIRTKLVDGLMVWKSDKKWYYFHQLPYKIGILLYGEPGTGKSTIIKAISHMFDNAPIVNVGKDVIGGLAELHNMRRTTSQTLILLLEDIDIIFENASRDYVNSYRVDTEILEQHQMLFQMLDGMWSMDNVITVATTNHYSKLDKALIRPSRFNIQVELTYFDKQRTIEFVNSFGLSEDFIDQLHTDYPIQPAWLQDKIIEHRAKERRNLK